MCACLPSSIALCIGWLSFATSAQITQRCSHFRAYDTCSDQRVSKHLAKSQTLAAKQRLLIEETHLKFLSPEFSVWEMPHKHRAIIKPADLEEEAGGATTSSDKSSKTSDMYASRGSSHNDMQIVEESEGEGIQFTLSRGILLVVLLVASLFSGVATYYFIAKNDRNDVYERVSPSSTS